MALFLLFRLNINIFIADLEHEEVAAPEFVVPH